MPAPDTAQSDDQPPVDASTGGLSLREVAHELNSLLDGSMRSVARALHELQGRETGAAEAIEPLHAAEAAMRDMGRIIAEALHAAPLPDADIDLESMIRRLVNQFAALASERGVNVVVDVEPGASGIRAAALQPALRNGLRNAIQAASIDGAPSQVEVLASVDRRDRLVLIISDTGPGLPSDEACPESGGHGVGLWLSERLVKELGGELSLTNTRIGGGAIWRLTIPMTRLRAP